MGDLEMQASQLDTPALIVDLDLMERNIKEMAEWCKAHNITLRPHLKPTKVPAIAHLLIDAGAKGICCQKLGEAEVMVQAGIKDILIPYNIVGKQKLERLTRLAKQCTLTVAVDSEYTARGISEQAQEDGCTVRVIVELYMSRTGVPTLEDVLGLAKKIIKMPSLSFEGIMSYPSDEKTLTTIELLKSNGIPVNMVSGRPDIYPLGSKEPLYHQIGLTEIRTGMYVLGAGKYYRFSRDKENPGKVYHADRCALRVICTVVSCPVPDKAIIDGGIKTFSSYRGPPYGYFVEYPNAIMNGMSVEHGHVDISECSKKPVIGEKLTVIPNHPGICLNLHDTLIGVRRGLVETIWPIEGRGKVQ
jgi:D-serine deaminase-like pyridoxal phosphate-dependent protein